MGGYLGGAQVFGPGVAMTNLSPLLGTALEHECPRCHNEVELPLGELCQDCTAAIGMRARKISRYVALGTTVPFAIYVYFRLPEDPTLRLLGISTVVAWYIITGLVTKRILLEVFK